VPSAQQFLGPIRVGDTLSLKQTIVAKEVLDERTGLVTLDMDIVNQHGGVSIAGTRYMLVIRKPQGQTEIASGPQAWH